MRETTQPIRLERVAFAFEGRRSCCQSRNELFYQSQEPSVASPRSHRFLQYRRRRSGKGTVGILDPISQRSGVAPPRFEPTRRPIQPAADRARTEALADYREPTFRVRLPSPVRKQGLRNSGFRDVADPRYQSYDFLRQTTIFCDFVGLSVASEGRLRREASDFLSNVFREVDG